MNSTTFATFIHTFFEGEDDSKLFPFQTNSLTQFVEHIAASVAFHKVMVQQGHAKEVQIVAAFGKERREIHIEMIRGQVSVNEFDVSDRMMDVLVP